MDPKNRDSLEDVGIIETMVKFLKIKVGIERLQVFKNYLYNNNKYYRKFIIKH